MTKEMISFRITSYNVCYTKLLRMLSPEGGFYASLDADSEGVEGKFYTWRADELQQILGDDFELFSDYFQVNHHGRWENDCYILLRSQTDEAFATKHKLDLDQLKSLINHWKETLLKIRNNRVITSYSIHYTKLYEMKHKELKELDSL